MEVLPDFSDHLPAWSYPQRIARLAEELAPNAVPLEAVAGEALPLQFVVLLLRCVFYLCFTVFVFTLSECEPDKGGVEGGVSAYPWWIWIALAPNALAWVVLLYRAHRYVVIPICQVNGGVKVFGKEMPYNLWLALAVIRSVLACTNTASDGAFLGSYLKEGQCLKGLDRSARWADILTVAYGPRLASTLTILPLAGWVWLTWAGPFFEVCFALAYVVPCRCDADYEIESPDEIQGGGASPSTKTYCTCAKPAQHHGAAFMTIAWCNDDAMSTGVQSRYRLNRCEQEFDATDRTRDFGYLEHALDATAEAVRRLFFKGLFSDGMQMFVQFSVMRLRVLTMPNLSREVVNQAYLSVFLSIVNLVADIYPATVCWARGSTWLKWGEDGVEELADPTRRVTARRMLNSLRWRRRRLAALTGLCILCVTGALLRLTMSLVCGAKVFTVEHGCVALP